MTTIATRGDGIVAADTQCSSDVTKVRVAKLFRLPCGGVVGGAGSFPEIVRAVTWLQRGCKGKAPKLKASDLMVCYPDGRVGVYVCGWILTEVQGPCAIGSGTQAALAAMNYYESSAEEAVYAAATADPNTSAPVEVMRVEPVKAKRKKK
jgi:hypothetical protein